MFKHNYYNSKKKKKKNMKYIQLDDKRNNKRNNKLIKIYSMNEARGAPSSNPSPLLHLVRDPLRQRLTARTPAKAIRDLM